MELLHELKQRTFSLAPEVFDRAIVLATQVGVGVARHGLAQHVRVRRTQTRRRHLAVLFAINPSLCDSHSVLSEGTSFIGVELRGATHGFARL